MMLLVAVRIGSSLLIFNSLDPCFAKECLSNERCIVSSDDKTTCGTFHNLSS